MACLYQQVAQITAIASMLIPLSEGWFFYFSPVIKEGKGGFLKHNEVELKGFSHPHKWVIF
jgi:hypothetical protein